MDEILLHEIQKVSAVKEVSGFLESDYNDNRLYQVENLFLKRLIKNLNAVSVRFNANRKLHIGSKIGII